MVGSKKLKAKSSKKPAKRSSGAVKKSPVAKNVKKALSSGSGGYSMDYVIALEIQKTYSGGSPSRSGSGGGIGDYTSAQELNLRNRTLSKTAAATDRVRKNISEINAPERGGMVPANRRSGRPAPTSTKNLDKQQLGLRNRTLKNTPPDKTPAKKNVQSVVAPKRGGMVGTGGRTKGKAK